jgi:hypothetical protein
MIIKDSDTIKQFKKILKNIPSDGEIYVGQGREEVNINEIDAKELYAKVTKWSIQSMNGLLCGILGCQENPKNQCPICTGSYCYEHIKIHFHHDCHDGIILKEIKE